MWTKNQENAIKKTGTNILVSAAAGSRKNGSISRENYK